MRVKLGLTDTEMMNSSYISLCLQSADFPWYDPKGKERIVVTGKQAEQILGKYM
jgi:hypothetical protein